ncbi:MAG: glycosyltransferase [Puniceicoccales bacterium]|jgi:glycosyltransferase involved in cell wall biosynthesis|nr:glycosyltransferase [Puniceicoccales bacterium]
MANVFILQDKNTKKTRKIAFLASKKLQNVERLSTFDTVKPKISIAIPVYNVAPYLRRALDSAVNQTMKDIEIICVDDGSTDNSLEILREYEQKDRRIKAFHQENHGLLNTRAKALREAHGDYILCLDSDDELILDVVEKTYAVATETGADMVGFQALEIGSWNEDDGVGFDRDPPKWRAFGPEGFQCVYRQPRIFTNFLNGKFPPNCWGVLIRREIYVIAIEKLGRVSTVLDVGVSCHEDFLQTIAMAPFIKCLVSTEIRGYLYYKRASSVMGCRTKTFENAMKATNDLIRIMDAIKIFCKSIGLSATIHTKIKPLQWTCGGVIEDVLNFPTEEFLCVFHRLDDSNLLSHDMRKRCRKIMEKKIQSERIVRHGRLYRFWTLIRTLVLPFEKILKEINRFLRKRIFYPLCKAYFYWQIRSYFRRQSFGKVSHFS